MTEGATSSSSFNYQWTYEVFINFRGTDTRQGFTGNLYNALRQKGIHTFIDDNGLRKGDEITPTLLKAIEESRMAIIVFSKDYASSTFCLNELVKILHCIRGKGRLVWPIFYHVDPSDVRHQKGNYEEALTALEKRSKVDEEKMRSWNLALCEAANLSGSHFPLGHGYEHEFIEGIVKEISSKINRTPLHIADFPIGLESRVSKINSLLGVGSNNEVNMVGIWGVGGVGKTTIARAIYNSIADHFESVCFLHDVKDKSSKFGLEQMQERMLSTILGMDIRVEDVNQGVAIIKRRLNHKKVLLILDDVDRYEQLEKFAGNCDWFGSGSRIIITTRDKQLLKSHGVQTIYHMKEFNYEESLELLSWNAFKSNQVDPTYKEVLRFVVQYAQGLPLALKVIGSHLYGRSVEEWKSALDNYRRIPDKDIQQILQVSYNSLQEVQQEIFLDIACFFNGENLEYVKDMVKHAHGFDPNYAIEVLRDKCLINIAYDEIKMHDLIQGMGREIVRQESPGEPGRRSRLWFHEDIIQVLENNTGTEKVSVIIPEHWYGNIKVDWDGKAFKRMKNLKILSLKKACFSKGPKYLPNSLRVLQWLGYPAPYLPADFDITKLAMLDLQGSCLQSLEPIKKCENMSVLNLNGCQFITHIPDVCGIPNLIELSFYGCQNLIDVHDSVGNLGKLKILEVGDCKKLRTFPRGIKMPYLKHLGLKGCLSLLKFPEILEKMKYLKYLDLDNVSLPCSICNITGLENLRVKGCTKDVLVPSSIDMFRELEVISSGGCREGQEEAGSPLFRGVRRLQLTDCNISDELLPICLTWFAHMQRLNLSDSEFTILPACIKECRFLTELVLDYCMHLREIRGIPPNIRVLRARGCISLSSESRSILLSQELHEAGHKLFVVPGSTIPEWLHHRSRGSSISFWFCNKPAVISLCCVKEQMVFSGRFRADVIVNGKETPIFDEGTYGSDSILSDHVQMLGGVEIPDKRGELNLSEWNHVEICFSGEVRSSYAKEMGIHVNKLTSRMEDIRRSSYAKEMGIHVNKQESGMEDIRFTSPYKRTKFDHSNSNFTVSTWLSGSGTATQKEAERESSVTSKKDKKPKLNEKRKLKELYGNFLRTSNVRWRRRKRKVDVRKFRPKRKVDVRKQEANMEDKVVCQTQDMKQQEDDALINHQIPESSENEIKAKGNDITVYEDDSNEKKGENTLEETHQNYRFSPDRTSSTWDPMECEHQLTRHKDPLDQSTSECEKGHDGMVHDQRRDPWLRLLCFNLFTLVASLCSPSSP